MLLKAHIVVLFMIMLSLLELLMKLLMNVTAIIQVLFFLEWWDPVNILWTYTNTFHIDFSMNILHKVVSGIPFSTLNEKVLNFLPCVIPGDFCYFCHWADDSASGQGVPEVIYNPVVIYGIMIFWIFLDLGLTSDIQYTRKKHT